MEAVHLQKGCDFHRNVWMDGSSGGGGKLTPVVFPHVNPCPGLMSEIKWGSRRCNDISLSGPLRCDQRHHQPVWLVFLSLYLLKKLQLLQKKTERERERGRGRGREGVFSKLQPMSCPHYVLLKPVGPLLLLRHNATTPVTYVPAVSSGTIVM